MHPTLRLGLFMAGMSCGAFAEAEVDHSLAMSVVQIHAYPEAGRVFFGSGVVVARDRVATNCHVTRFAHSVVVAKGALRYRAIAQQADPTRDLCLLAAPGVPLPAATLGSVAKLSVGETVYLYGYPRAIGMAFSQGHIQALHPFQGSLIIETSADFTHGGSGGGMFDDSGKLIGLATFLGAGEQGRHYAIPADWILPLTGASVRNIEPIGGSPFWENAADLPDFLRPPGGQPAISH